MLNARNLKRNVIVEIHILRLAVLVELLLRLVVRLLLLRRWLVVIRSRTAWTVC